MSSNYGMRWDGQSVSVDDGALPGLQRIGFVRSVRTPQFDGITFHEVLCKSALNKVPDASMLPFRYTVNGYRGCSHACRYCFARPTHEYLEMDCGTDFDTQVVVKTNVAEVLRRELHRKSWRRETVALGTNTDPYQRAEGRYALMPGIIARTGRLRHAVLHPHKGHPAAPRPCAHRGCSHPRRGKRRHLARGGRPVAAQRSRAGNAVSTGATRSDRRCPRSRP